MTTNPTSTSAATVLTDTSEHDVPSPPKPVSQAERIQTIDILRGVALLGILLMNIPYFSMAERFSDAFNHNPRNVNFWLDAVITVLFEGKMRALFSMIFGVGIILFMARKEKSGNPSTTGQSATGPSRVRLFFQRMGWLVLFGLIDSHVLLWMGDILYYYGVIGMIAFWFRRMKPVYLALGVPLVAIVGFALNTMFYQSIREKRLAFLAAQKTQQQGQTLTQNQQQAIKTWKEAEKEFFPNKAEIAEHTRKMKSPDYFTVASRYQKEVWDAQTKYLVFQLWDPLALMLLGMALYQWGFVTGQWPRRRYWQMMLLGYGLGLSLVTFSFYYYYQNIPNSWAFIPFMEQHPVQWVALIYPFQRILLVMAHASLIILLVKGRVVQGLLNRLAAVGQMAFTNYVMHTLICTSVFYGYGLNQYAEWEFYQLYFLVAAIWTLQLIVSPIWLRHFQFGPLEWAWRSLTYWQRQPMRPSPINAD
ncbi:DUF418 domain-containing protein [Spirosoma sp. KUDC1026]|uniref:DUF418 domain-containing protein n=1 Tax=Spirosoma sp. KUDC1026 TaxID=2745947 RepID=UPI00159B9B10|nr:DUF418 domain-containing protein [Spirosoma sp. KUDC1026]QKZ13499.1 DUF418 domain-containing protein [Spirosoma sp. KUDC1026]